MTLLELKTQYRIATLDTAVPYLWSDEELADYATDAESEAARRAHLLVDASGECSFVSVSAGDTLVVLDERVIYIRRARMASGTLPLVFKTVSAMDEEMPGWDAAKPSVSRVLIPDAESGAVGLYPPPVADDTLLMTVVRVPLYPLVKDADVPEIPSRYHRSLVNWMLYRGYSKHDGDGFDEKKAAVALVAFEAEFGPRSRAIDEHWSREQYYYAGDYQ